MSEHTMDEQVKAILMDDRQRVNRRRTRDSIVMVWQLLVLGELIYLVGSGKLSAVFPVLALAYTVVALLSQRKKDRPESEFYLVDGLFGLLLTAMFLGGAFMLWGMTPRQKTALPVFLCIAFLILFGVFLLWITSRNAAQDNSGNKTSLLLLGFCLLGGVMGTLFIGLFADALQFSMLIKLGFVLSYVAAILSSAIFYTNIYKVYLHRKQLRAA